MACTAVLAIAELLEEILLNLPQRDLLRLQCVSHSWFSTIANSPTLQQKLCFQAAAHEAKPTLNPLLQEVFPPFFDVGIVPNTWDNCEENNSPYDIMMLDWFSDDKKRASFMREEASWRRMFPIQPPAKVEELFKTGGCQCGGIRTVPGWVRGEFSQRQEAEGGVRMGALWDLVVFMVDLVPAGEFFVEWMGIEFMAKDEVEEEIEYDDDGNEIVWGNDEDEERDVVKDAEHGWRVVPAKRNAITVHLEWSHECYPSAPVPCGLKIVEFDEGNFEYGRD